MCESIEKAVRPTVACAHNLGTHTLKPGGDERRTQKC